MRKTIGPFLSACIVILLRDTLAQTPAITLTSSKTNLNSDQELHVNCTVTPYNARWTIQIMKTKFQVTTPGGSTYTLEQDGWPQYIANNSDLNPAISSEAGARYTASHMASADDNMIKSMVAISSTRPEDSGVWSCRVLMDNDVVGTASEPINIQIDGPIQYVKVYVEAMPGENVFQNQTLSDGVSYAFVDGTPTSMTCEVGVPSSTGPVVGINIEGGSNESDKDLTSSFSERHERSSSEVKAGGLVMHTAHLAYTARSFTPSVLDHGKRFSCSAALEGYPTINATFSLNIQSPPRINCTSKTVAAPIGTKDVEVTCVIAANPPVVEAVWGIPALVDDENVTTTSKADGLSLNATLLIRHVTQQHYHSQFNVTATNIHGTASESIRIVDRIVSASGRSEWSATAGLVVGLVLIMLRR